MRRVGIGATPTCVSLGLAPVVSPFASPTVVEASAVCCLFFLPLLHRVAPFSSIYHPRLSFLSLPSLFHRSYLSFRLLIFPSFSSPFSSSLLLPSFPSRRYPLLYPLLCQLRSIMGSSLNPLNFRDNAGESAKPQRVTT